jgi:hypothetical protein
MLSVVMQNVLAPILQFCKLRNHVSISIFSKSPVGYKKMNASNIFIKFPLTNVINNFTVVAASVA